MKHLLAFLCALTIVSIGVAGMLTDRAGTSPVSVQPRPPEPERFEGSAETLSPEELHRARVRNTPTLAALREAEEAEREEDRRFAILLARPRSIRLPSGYKWGRCLLVVAAETRISGSCAYDLAEDGGFHIAGPRQIYGGIDYPKREYQAAEISNDYWADLFRDPDGGWTGYGNSDPIATHGELFGSLGRRGPCFVGKDVRVCLWKTPPKSRRPKTAKPSGPERKPEGATQPLAVDTIGNSAIAAPARLEGPGRDKLHSTILEIYHTRRPPSTVD